LETGDRNSQSSGQITPEESALHQQSEDIPDSVGDFSPVDSGSIPRWQVVVGEFTGDFASILNSF
jgi:hypothetical protein